ncbi:DUF2752 domain-containing protein [Amycolatopsis sp. SID8362]|uniref:DUF2752 domain-containing protein n=1 Tax=Amycolatopsis sp. SID8362 TaxID=2690346 RepID=UPI00136C41BE|nr:DUF2752 domain-containing protein [Amycolatopsis sp. SID8362]NBH11831.1 DUF2752 domain-containing protein [Amycolatopsis sp. SID8362]NED48522.1 DUF2752 domain-containing protein [Amycolatopsis sp. SID8362]
MTATTVYTGIPAQGTKAKLRAIGPPLALVAGLGVCCAVVWVGDPTTPGGFLPVCPTKALFGIDCPGCGGMRMAYSLMHGDIPAALHYNAVSFVVVLLFVWSTAAWTLGRLRGRAMDSWLHWRWTPLTFSIVFVVWFVIRNLPFAPFTALRV